MANQDDFLTFHDAANLVEASGIMSYMDFSNDPKEDLPEHGDRPPYKYKRGELEGWIENIDATLKKYPIENKISVPVVATKPQVQFVKYEAARKALAEAVAVDEVKAVRDESMAMKAYAKQAKDTELQEKAVELQMRATRRLNEMMDAQKETVGLSKGGRPKTGLSENPVSPLDASDNRVMPKPSLKDAGIDKNLAHEARQLGKLSDEEFEKEVEEEKAKVRAPRGLRKSSSEPKKRSSISYEFEITNLKDQVRVLLRDLGEAKRDATVQRTGLSEKNATLLNEAKTIRQALGSSGWAATHEQAIEALAKKANGEYDE